jgi:hypothetical protein
VPYGGSKQSDTPLRSLAVSLTHVARAALTEPYMLSIEHERIQLNRLPKVFDGFRVVQLSDIHHGPFSSTEQIERAVDTANRLSLTSSRSQAITFRKNANTPRPAPRCWVV